MFGLCYNVKGCLYNHIWKASLVYLQERIFMFEVQGNIDGVRRSYIERLEGIYELTVERKEFCTDEILESLAFFTGATGREAMVYIDRNGKILSVAVGESDRVSLQAMSKRRSRERLSGIRCIHTHPKGGGALSSVDIQTLKSLRLDAMAAIGVQDGKAVSMQIGILDGAADDGELTVNLLGPYRVWDIPHELLWEKIELADATVRSTQVKTEFEIARAILVGIDGRIENGVPLYELLQLAKTAGFITIGSIVQQRDKPDNSYYLGYGKLHDLTLDIQRLQADTVIFDDELSPGQIRNIQKELGKRIEIIDRTALILDIFSNRASTHEGRLQVELAQVKYLLPRMVGYWTHMTRMAGGGAGGGGARRGEGETQLEVDRRLLRKRGNELEKEIDKIKLRRDVGRAKRERSGIPVVALVGYTNAGKSTLMNHLSGSNVLAEDKLFATLDSVSRRINYGFGDFLLVDTVGFIKKLPHDLVNAFRATLEEARYADLLLHVVDTSSEDRDSQMEVVREVLTHLEANTNPTITVYNKCDILSDILTNPGADPVFLTEDTVAISAKTGMGMDKLKDAIAQKLALMRRTISVLLPLDAGGLLSRIYENGQVNECEYLEDGIRLTAIVTVEDAARLQAVAREIY
jgi:GTP-binding protein HflX